MSNVDKDMGVVFDLDGVLVDTGEFHKQAWYDLAQKQGFEMSEQLFYSTFGMQNYQIILCWQNGRNGCGGSYYNPRTNRSETSRLSR